MSGLTVETAPARDLIRPVVAASQIVSLGTQADREQVGAELNDRAIFPLFEIGLSLQAIAARLSPSDCGESIGRCVEELDRVIFELRDCIYRSE